jgi:S-adenosyl methyltransferase
VIVWLWDAGARRGVTDDETRAFQAAEALIRSGQAASARVEKAHLVTGIRALESGYTRTGHGCRITYNAATSQGTTVEPLSAPLPPYVNHPNVARVYDYLLVLHFITDAEDPWSIIRTFRNVMARGSYLAVTHITDDGVDPDVAKAAQEVYADASAPAVPRGYADILRFFDGMELVPRGLVDVNAWPFPGGDRKINPRVLIYGGVARRF